MTKAARKAENSDQTMEAYEQLREAFGEIQPENPSRHGQSSARLMACFLAGIMVFTLVGHYVIILVLSLMGDHGHTIALMSDVFAVWFPVITGFAGGAITYFLASGNA